MCLVVAWFAVLSLIHKKYGHTALYGILIVISIAAFYLMFSSGCLAPLYGLIISGPVRGSKLSKWLSTAGK